MGEGTLSQNVGRVSVSHALTQLCEERDHEGVCCFSFQDSQLVCVRHQAVCGFWSNWYFSCLFVPFHPSVNSQVQMLETVMSLAPGCQRGSEQRQPCLQHKVWTAHEWAQGQCVSVFFFVGECEHVGKESVANLLHITQLA